MTNKLDSEKVLRLYEEYEALKEKQKEANEDLKFFKDRCDFENIPFKVFQRVYTAEQKAKSSCSTVRNEVKREFDTVQILENMFPEKKKN